MSDEYLIATSRLKIAGLIAIGIMFTAIGWFMFQQGSEEIEAQRRFNDPVVVHGIGLAAMAFFGLGTVFGIGKLFDKRPGVVLSSAGLLDNSSFISCGLVPWSDITGFATCEINKQKMLVVFVVNPENYIGRGNLFKRKLKRASARMVGSPISISANSLRIDVDALFQLSEGYLQRYGAGQAMLANPVPG